VAAKIQERNETASISLQSRQKTNNTFFFQKEKVLTNCINRKSSKTTKGKRRHVEMRFSTRRDEEDNVLKGGS